ncbi:acyltransferase family protein [uncultured Desulfuromusa sp.]|uniref:acyltransferase family protein n=1 Tax=uncultured Desulfuromusa sp. TaxID=219183 RepID=UPI002AA6B1AF|nr:acyltransferase family protein [uncultured Desulfuromusa sp.]
MRYHYLDFARGLLMSLGVVIHSAQVYSLEPWRVHSEENSLMFNHIINIIHLFRMPSFYVISGFFAMMLYQRYSLKNFYLNRLIRLGVPLFFCGLFLNSINHYLSYGNAAKGLSAFDLSYWLGGGWLGQLWFLANLIIYIVFLALLMNYFKEAVSKISYLKVPSISIFILIPLVLFLTLRIAWRLPTPPYGDAWIFITTTNFIFYLPFFLLGVIFFVNQTAFKEFMDSVLLAFVGLIIYLTLYYVNLENSVYVYLKEISSYLCLVCFIVLMLKLFNCYFNRNSNLIRSISDSSYTVYLVHPPILLIIASFLIETSLNIYVQFSILVVSVWFLSYMVHVLLVRKFKIINFLLNGKYS